LTAENVPAMAGAENAHETIVPSVRMAATLGPPPTAID